MVSITRQISSYNFSSGNTVKYIVIHDTGNYKDTASGNSNYFNGGDRQASAHYFVDENSIYQVVEEFNASWHCGDGYMQYGIGNHNSIGIEMCNSGGYIADATIKNTIDLVKVLMSKYNVGIDNVVRHYDASRKVCPNNMSANNWSKWYEFKAQLGGASIPSTNNVPSTPTNVNSFDVLTIQQTLNKLKFVGANGNKLSEDGITGDNTTYAIKQFQTVCGLSVDGIVGFQTNNCMQQILAKPLCGIPYVQRIPTRYIQWRLHISTDGVFGSQTAQAVQMYQTSRGLGADGIVGQATWSSLIG